MFKNSGVPFVISVNHELPVVDEYARQFAKYFYGFILKGYTVKKAFEDTETVIENKGTYSNTTITICNEH